MSTEAFRDDLFAGAVALVVGGTSGIGAARRGAEIASSLARPPLYSWKAEPSSRNIRSTWPATTSFTACAVPL